MKRRCFLNDCPGWMIVGGSPGAGGDIVEGKAVMKMVLMMMRI